MPTHILLFLTSLLFISHSGNACTPLAGPYDENQEIQRYVEHNTNHSSNIFIGKVIHTMPLLWTKDGKPYPHFASLITFQIKQGWGWSLLNKEQFEFWDTCPPTSFTIEHNHDYLVFSSERNIQRIIQSKAAKPYLSNLGPLRYEYIRKRLRIYD